MSSICRFGRIDSCAIFRLCKSNIFLVCVVITLLMKQGILISNLSSLPSLEYEVTSAKPSDRKRSCSPNQKISAALVMFGVPKSFDIVWESYIRNIIERNPHVYFELHLHMYSDISVVMTPRNLEINATVDNPATIQSILNSKGEVSLHCKTSSQKEFDESFLSWFGTDTLFNYDIYTTMNIFRQGNSMKEAYLSASQRDNGNITSIEGIDHCGNITLYVFLRSDTLLLSVVDIPKLGIGSRDLMIPKWQARPSLEYNDRFAIAGSYAANVYASAKSVGFKQMILDKREKNESFSALRNPETMLRIWLDKHDLNISVLSDWAKLLRVRANGNINDRDSSTFNIVEGSNIHNLSFL